MSPRPSTPLPTDRPEALKSFVEGRDRFNSYLGTGTSGDLENASRLFEEAANSDPKFDLALFYHALTRAELRDSDTAVRELNELISKGVKFLPEAYLHLAYAHTKYYRDEEYFKAEKALEHATTEVEKSGEKRLKPVIQAYRVFLYSVMGGRLKADTQKRQEYTDKAIRLGEKNLRRRLWRRDLIKLELLNALGIAYMRKGQESGAFSEQQKKWWRLARSRFQAALKLGFNSVRVHQNIGTLLGIEGDQWRKMDESEKAADCYHQAIREYNISIDINPLDQFPHYSLARLYIRLGKWDLAHERLIYGRKQRGAVSWEKWEQVEEAIEKKNAAVLDEKPVSTS